MVGSEFPPEIEDKDKDNPLVATNETFDLAGPAGRLEAILMLPDGEAQAAAVVCHAHPLQGGVMHFKVVFRAAKALQAENVATLRFNFRGVGRSEGRHDEGRGEQDDVRAALDELAAPLPRASPPHRRLLVRLRDGAAHRLRRRARPRAVRARLPDDDGDRPLVPADVHAPAALRPGRATIRSGRAAALRDFVETLPEPKTLGVVPGADHFFTGQLDRLQEAVRAWAATRPWEAA